MIRKLEEPLAEINDKNMQDGIEFEAGSEQSEHIYEKKKSSRPSLQSAVFWINSEEEMRNAVDAAFEYRGDVSILLDDNTVINGFVFDRRLGSTGASSVVRVIPTQWKADTEKRITISCSRIRAIKFSGRDAADGLTWEAWVERYRRKQKQKADSNK